MNNSYLSSCYRLLSGADFADQHQAILQTTLHENSASSWFHWAVSWIEYTPIVGLVARFFENIALLFQKNDTIQDLKIQQASSSTTGQATAVKTEATPTLQPPPTENNTTETSSITAAAPRVLTQEEQQNMETLVSFVISSILLMYGVNHLIPAKLQTFALVYSLVHSALVYHNIAPTDPISRWISSQFNDQTAPTVAAISDLAVTLSPLASFTTAYGACQMGQQTLWRMGRDLYNIKASNFLTTIGKTGMNLVSGYFSYSMLGRAAVTAQARFSPDFYTSLIWPPSPSQEELTTACTAMKLPALLSSFKPNLVETCKQLVANQSSTTAGISH